MLLFSFTFWRTDASVTLSFQLFFSILFQIQISKSCNHFLSAFASVQVSATYGAILQTKHLTILFHKSRFKQLQKSFLLSINAFFPKAILLQMSFFTIPIRSDHATHKYLNSSTSSMHCLSIRIFVLVSFPCDGYTHLLSFQYWYQTCWLLYIPLITIDWLTPLLCHLHVLLH